MKSPQRFDFQNEELPYFLTVLETKDEIIVTFPGTRKNLDGLKDLGAYNLFDLGVL